jgi:hypothetical protein|nr:MAG TPA: tail connector protein [Caudoviricetes sp.]
MLDKNQFISALKDKVQVIHILDNEESEALAGFLAAEMADRLSLYLNLGPQDMFDERLVNISVRVVIALFEEVKDRLIGTNTNTRVKSLSDNGQTVTFDNVARSYISSTSDIELFGGVSEVLKPYRRIRVFF